MIFDDLVNFLKSYKNVFLPLLVILIYIALVSIGITNSSFSDVDASRHALDGLYYHDLIKSIFSGQTGISFSSIYDFTTEQFLRYPALGLLWWPPFFPLVEAFFYMLLGVSVVSAKMCVIFFGALGIIFWYLLIRLVFNKYRLGHSLAFFSSLLFAVMPFILKYSGTIMREIPAVSLCIVSSYFFVRWIHDGQKERCLRCDNSIIFAAIFWAFAILTKSETIFLGVIFLVYLLYKKGFKMLFEKKALISIALFLILVVPWVFIALKFQPERLGESFGNLGHYSRLSIDNWVFYIKTLSLQMGLPLCVVAIAGLLYSTIKDRRKEFVFFWIYSAVVYLFFSIVSWKDARYTLYYLPFLTLFAVYLVLSLKLLSGKKRAAFNLALLILLVGSTIFVSLSSHSEDFEAYSKAAAYVMDNPQPESTIFFLGNGNGNFIYNVRLLDDHRSAIVLRGSIYLTSFNIYTTWGSQDFLDDEQKIYDFFDEMGVYYVVVEEPVPFVDPSNNNSKYPVFTMFERMLESDNFSKLWSDDVYSRSLNIYRYERYKPITKDELTIPLFAIGRNVTVSIK